MLNDHENLLQHRNLPLNIACGDQAIATDVTNFINQVTGALDNGTAMLPVHPGFERHPYKGILNNYSAEKYIIGTFPPVSYLIDTLRGNGAQVQTLQQPTPPFQPIEEPNIPLYHGNVSSLWAVLLSAEELEELDALLPNDREGARTFLMDWLTENGICYDDIIMFAQRQLGHLQQGNIGYTAADANLKNICPDLRLVEQVLRNEALKVLCFTNGATFGSGNDGGLKVYTQVNRRGLVKTSKSDALSLFLRTCQDIGLTIEMRCLPHFDWTALQNLTDIQKKTKLIFELRVAKTQACRLESLQSFSQKTLTVITPFSPAAHGNIEYHPIVVNFRLDHGDLACDEILKWIYERLRTDTYDQLYPYNINE